MNQNTHYNKKHKGLARALRKDMTKAEACLWKYALKSSQRGVKFRRQRPIDLFIVDFICLPLKLIIEVDGITHQDPKVIKKDKDKDKRLSELGFHVLRFEDVEVLNDINAVIYTIDEEIKKLSNVPPQSLCDSLPMP